MNKKLTLRILAFTLAALTAVPMLASCEDDKKDDSGSAATTTVKSGSDVEEENADAEVESLYGDNDFGGAKVRILGIEGGSWWYGSMGEGANEIWFENADSDVLQRAVYERNRKTQNLINIEIEPVWAADSNVVTERLNQDVAAGVDDYDMALDCLGDAMGVAQNRNLINFNSLDSFDAAHSWWNERFVDECTIYGETLYAVAGAINILDDCANNVIIFNKDLLEKYNCDDPYQLVFDGEWTVDAFMKSAKAVTQDLNGDQEFDGNDSWGIGTYGNGLLVGLAGLDSPIARMSDDGIPEITCGTELAIDKAKYWFDNVTNSDCLYNEGICGEESFQQLFEEGQIGFALTNLTHTFTLRNMEDEYGILPLAKYNADQQEYTSSANTAFFTVFVIPKSCKEPEMVATTLEVMGGYAVGTVDASLHDIVFESKLTRDAESRRVLKICQETVSFDWADIGGWARVGGTGLTSSFAGQRMGASFTLASALASQIDSAQESLNEMIDAFE